jgi:hypothetical protein
VKRRRVRPRQGEPKAFSRRSGLFVRLNLTLPLHVAKALRDTAVERQTSISLTGEQAIRFYLGLRGAE